MLGEFLRALLALVVSAAVAATEAPVRDSGAPAPAAPSAAPSAGPSGPASVTRPVTGPVIGADISWPNCPRGMGMKARPTLGKPLPRRNARFVIIGLTNGPAFHPNPCLEAHVTYARERRMWAAAYAVATYPTRKQLRGYGDDGPADPNTRRGRLFNTGFAQAKLNVRWMREAGLDSPVVWVDVEPVSPPAPWSGRVRENKAVVDGVLRAYREEGLEVGFYSVATLWRQIMGTTSYGIPEWRSAGPTTRARALAMCTSGRFQGGRAVIGQWWDDDRDYNVLCPGRPAERVLARWFTKF